MKTTDKPRLKEAALYERLGGDRVHCCLCAHHCRISPSGYGFCGVRQNVGGTLYTQAYGRVVAAQVDPIEKKPLFHFLPGSRSFSVATIGCNFRCGFCQNWQISQSNEARALGVGEEEMSPDAIVTQALSLGCRSISYTYTEPTIFFEYAFDTARLAREKGLANIFVTNGYMTEQALDTIRPYLDAANVDLKFFDESKYRRVCKASLQPVLDTIRRMKKAGVWVEVTTLVIPGQNDSDKELGAIASFLAETGKDIPWHISMFHPDYQFTDIEETPLSTLHRAHELGLRAGLRYVYMGNTPGEENTCCYHCGALVIERSGFSVVQNRLKGGKCPNCSTPLDGKW